MMTRNCPLIALINTVYYCVYFRNILRNVNDGFAFVARMFVLAQARANGLQSCVIVIRIMRDLCQRVPTPSSAVFPGTSRVAGLELPGFAFFFSSSAADVKMLLKMSD